MSPASVILSVLILAWLPGRSIEPTASQQSKPAQVPKNEVALRKAVNAFWSAWHAKDYQKASLYVLNEQRRQFLRLKKFPVRKWEILSLEFQEQGRQALVHVKIERFEPFMGSYFEWQQKATWIRKGSSWFMEIPEGRSESP